jgi:cytochrome c oxidase assembly protein subunit 11
MTARSSLAVRKRRTVLAAAAAIAGMAGLVVYSPTLYRVFCEVTGYGGTTQRVASAPAVAADRTITVRFTAETHPDLPWYFGPAQPEMRVKVGEQHLAYYVAENRSNEPTTGMAVFNVAPYKAGPYFNKIACFCFDEKTLEARQRIEMPVSFFIDPKILDDRNLDDVHTITLSYTFYRVSKPKQAEQPAAARNPRN